MLAFRVGCARFAVELDNVLGVLETVGQPVSGGSDLAFQGNPVRAVSARDLGWGGTDAPALSHLPAAIIVRSEGAEATALVVDRIEGIVEGVETRPLPDVVAAHVRGVFRAVALHGEGWRLVVDPAALPGAAGQVAAEGGRGGPEGA